MEFTTLQGLGVVGMGVLIAIMLIREVRPLVRKNGNGEDHSPRTPCAPILMEKINNCSRHVEDKIENQNGELFKKIDEQTAIQQKQALNAQEQTLLLRNIANELRKSNGGS